MDKIHLKRIDDLIKIVPYFIDMLALWPHLIRTRIFYQDDCNIPTCSSYLKILDTIKDIFSKTKTEGPDAYSNLILSLRLSDQIFIADMLDIIN